MSRIGDFACGLRDRGVARWQRLAQGPRWDLAAAGSFTLVSLVLYLAASSKNPASDGHYSWIFARSLAYDGDLDFRNDYAQCGDPFGVGIETLAHRPANLFYVGPAVFWTPAIWVLKHFVGGPFASGCRGTIPNVVLAMSSVAGGVFVLATSATLRRWFSPRVAALATLLVTLGGHLVYFTGMNPSYSHAYDAMCVALFVYFTVRMREEPERRALWIVAGCFLGLAILQRAIDLAFFAVTLAAMGRRVRAAVAVLVVASVTGLAPLLLATHAIAGHWAFDTHGPHFIRWGHAHPILLIFDQRGGVFAMAPLLWLAVPGFVLLARRRAAWFFVAPMVACVAVELYVSSAALDWQGARRLVNTTGLAAAAVAALVEPCAAWLLAKPRRMASALGFVAIGAVAWEQACVSVGYRAQRIPWDRPVSLGGRYGEGEAAVLDDTESVVGPLTAAPASWIFALRYGLKPAAWAWATHPDTYVRNSTTLDWDATSTGFASPEKQLQMRGFRFDGDRACLAGSAGSFVVALQWPVVTRVRLTYDATADATLAVGSRSFLGVRTPWARVAVARGQDRDVYLAVPAGALDSGVNEIVFDVAGTASGVCLRGLEFADDTKYPASADSLASFPITIWHARQRRETRWQLLGAVPHRSPDNRFAGHVVGVLARGDTLVMTIDGREKAYDHGSWPAIAIDATTGHGVEVHDGDGGVWSHELDVLP